MRFSTERLRGPAALAAAVGLLAAGACSADGEGDTSGPTVEPGSDAGPEAERLYQIVNEGSAIEDELISIEQRVAKRCMEDEGFDVHDAMVFQESETRRLLGFRLPGERAGPGRSRPLKTQSSGDSAIWTQFVNNPGNEALGRRAADP